MHHVMPELSFNTKKECFFFIIFPEFIGLPLVIKVEEVSSSEESRKEEHFKIKLNLIDKTIGLVCKRIEGKTFKLKMQDSIF